MGRRRQSVIVVLGVFAVLKIFASVRHPQVFPDSPSYGQLNFIGGSGRLWTIPAVYNLLPANVAREAFQILLGIACWSALAINLGRSVNDRVVGAAAFGLVLLLGLVPEVTTWDGAMISESISTSLLVLLVAIAVRPQVSGRRLASALGVLMLWAFARQENVVTFLLFAPILVACAIWRLPARLRATTVISLLVLAVWSGYSVFGAIGDLTLRVGNAAEVATGEWAHQPNTLRYLSDQGLPVRLVRHASHLRRDQATWLAAQPRFRTWVKEHFMTAYVGLATRDLRLFTYPLSFLPVAASSPIYGYQHTVAPLPIGWIWDTARRLWIIFTALLMAAAIRLRMRAPWLPLLLLAASGVFAVQAIDLADSEWLRLMLPADIALHLGLLIGDVWAIDRLISLGLRRRQIRCLGSLPS